MNRVGKTQLTKFPDGTANSNLRKLNLKRNRFGNQTMSDWVQTGAFVPLNHLNLGWNVIGDEGAKTLSHSPTIGKLN